MYIFLILCVHIDIAIAAVFWDAEFWMYITLSICTLYTEYLPGSLCPLVFLQRSRTLPVWQSVVPPLWYIGMKSLTPDRRKSHSGSGRLRVPRREGTRLGHKGLWAVVVTSSGPCVS